MSVVESLSTADSVSCGLGCAGSEKQFVRAADICLSIGTMNELGSLIPSNKREKTKEPDFGTYHHSTSVTSKKVRTIVKAVFVNAFDSLPLGTT